MRSQTHERRKGIFFPSNFSLSPELFLVENPIQVFFFRNKNISIDLRREKRERKRRKEKKKRERERRREKKNSRHAGSRPDRQDRRQRRNLHSLRRVGHLCSISYYTPALSLLFLCSSARNCKRRRKKRCWKVEKNATVLILVLSSFRSSFAVVHYHITIISVSYYMPTVKPFAFWREIFFSLLSK